MTAGVGDAAQRPQVAAFRVGGRQQAIRDLRRHLHDGNAEFLARSARRDVLQPVLGEDRARRIDQDDPRGASVDRVVLREDQSFGQRVLAYAVRAVGTDGRAAPFSNGTAVGNKRIDLGATVAGGTLELELVTTALGLPPIVEFAAFKPCASA